MARYDKYDPISGGFRAPLAADWAKADEGVPLAVSLDANGRVVKGTAGQSGIVGVLVVDKTPGTIINKHAGDVVDVMDSGEIVDCTGFTAGQPAYAATSGAIATPGATGNLAVGHTVEATRLVVRVTKGAKS